MKSAQETFQKGMDIVNVLDLSDEYQQCLKEIELLINKTFKNFESKIDEALIKGKDIINNWDDAGKLYHGLIAQSPTQNIPWKLHIEWHKIQLGIDLKFKEIVESLGQIYDWIMGCFCKECKSAKHLSEKESKQRMREQWIQLGLVETN